MGIAWYATRYTQYEIPNGGLPVNNREASALFHYYVTARATYERVNTEIRYEHEHEDIVNYNQLFSSVARMYGVEPEKMVKHWAAVDFTCTLHSLPKLPDEEKYRMNRTIEVK